ncbi:MAG: DUF3301 domain-containing protein [Gammaproteobacteria bacterium]|jgi:hypothetical protein
MQDIFLIVVLAIVAWYWWDTMQSKEIARQAGRRVCQQNDVQFLDDTVEKKKIWVRRGPHGRPELCRLFFFEFATDGAHRYQGRIVVLGKTVSDVSMDAYRMP